MSAAFDLDALLNRIPELDPEPVKDQAPPGRLRVQPSKGKFTGPTWEELAPALEAVLANGAAGASAAVDRVKEIDDGSDYRARCLLHAAAIWTGRPGQAAARQAFEAVLLKEIAAKRPAGVRRFLIQQLCFCGTRRSIDALAGVLVDTDLFEDAAMAMQAIGDGAATA